MDRRDHLAHGEEQEAQLMAESQELARQSDRFDHFAADLVVLHDPHGRQASDLRRLAQTLALRSLKQQQRSVSLSVISAQRGEGRSSVAANLACAYALSGLRVLLIDADSHAPSQQERFGIEPGRSEGAIECPVPGIAELSLITAQSMESLELSHYLQRPLKALIERRSGEFGAIIVDTASAASSNDYQVAALATGSALAVTREGHTRARLASRMLNSCDDAGVTVLGGVMLAH